MDDLSSIDVFSNERIQLIKKNIQRLIKLYTRPVKSLKEVLFKKKFARYFYYLRSLLSIFQLFLEGRFFWSFS